MTPFSFDTLSASKQLREAGMPEGMAEAVVSVFQHAYEPVDLSHLATKADVADMATKADIADMPTKDDVEALRVATKSDLDAQGALLKSEFRAEIMASEARLRETIRVQGWALMGGVGLMLAVFGGVAGFLN